MDRHREYYAKGNKPARKEQTPYDFTYMQNPMNKINKHTKKKQVCRYKKLTAVRGEVVWGWGLGNKSEEIKQKANK